MRVNARGFDLPCVHVCDRTVHTSPRLSRSPGLPWRVGELRCGDANSYPTLMESHRFRFTRRMGPWTSLTSNPSSVLLAVLKTGENGGWSTAVVRWRMQYSLRHRQRYD